MKKKLEREKKKGSLLRLNNFIFLTIIRKIQNERTYPVVFMREAQTRQKKRRQKAQCTKAEAFGLP